MTTIQRLDELKEDLSLIGPYFDTQIEAIKASHLTEIKALQPKPKKVIAKKPKEQPIKVEITEAGKTTEVIFHTEKECDTFLKLKQKQRLKTAQSPIGLEIPIGRYNWGTYESGQKDYRETCAKHWQAAEAQNLTFTVKISRP